MEYIVGKTRENVINNWKGFKMKAEISYYYQKNFADFKMRRSHTHGANNFEIMYVKEGRCRVKTDAGDYSLSAGNFILLGNHCPHTLEAQNATILNIEFYIKRGNIELDDLLMHHPDIEKLFSVRALCIADKSSVFSALRSLIEELRRDGDEYYEGLLFKRLLLEIIRSYNLKISSAMSYVAEARKYIANHFCEKLSIDEIAGVIGINRSYLQSLFKSATGKTILEYINSLRIEKACFIMKNTDLAIIDIAVDCGFASRQHFLYVFKKHMGITAREYRKGSTDFERE